MDGSSKSSGRPKKKEKVRRDIVFEDVSHRLHAEPEWYTGEITAFNAEKEQYHVVYEDGEEDWEEFEEDGGNVKFLREVQV